MTDQTPSTEDDLLETISDYAHDFDRGGHLTLDDVKHAIATRDAARDREVAAKALREAAAARWPHSDYGGFATTSEQVNYALNLRADRIDKEV